MIIRKSLLSRRKRDKREKRNNKISYDPMFYKVIEKEVEKRGKTKGKRWRMEEKKRVLL